MVIQTKNLLLPKGSVKLQLNTTFEIPLVIEDWTIPFLSVEYYSQLTGST